MLTWYSWRSKWKCDVVDVLDVDVLSTVEVEVDVVERVVVLVVVGTLSVMDGVAEEV